MSEHQRVMFFLSRNLGLIKFAGRSDLGKPYSGGRSREFDLNLDVQRVLGGKTSWLPSYRSGRPPGAESPTRIDDLVQAPSLPLYFQNDCKFGAFFFQEPLISQCRGHCNREKHGGFKITR